eukprot:scaffold7548_cov126-Isochrysis_galbana.AAC.5
MAAANASGGGGSACRQLATADAPTSWTPAGEQVEPLCPRAALEGRGRLGCCCRAGASVAMPADPAYHGRARSAGASAPAPAPLSPGGVSAPLSTDWCPNTIAPTELEAAARAAICAAAAPPLASRIPLCPGSPTLKMCRSP